MTPDLELIKFFRHLRRWGWDGLEEAKRRQWGIYLIEELLSVLLELVVSVCKPIEG